LRKTEKEERRDFMGSDSNRFVGALVRHDLASIRQVPKSDLHNHFVLGGCRDYIFQQTGIKIPSLDRTVKSIQDMHEWCEKHIGLGHRFDSLDLHRVLLEAAFHQARKDGVKILEIGEDVWANAKYYGGDVSLLVDTFLEVRQRVAPCTELRFQIGLSRHCPVNLLEKWLEPFWGRKEFYSIDLSGDELAQPIENFVPIYRRAKGYGLKLKAHIGEWGTTHDVIRGVELLELDEVQHGIAAAGSQAAMDYFVENGIRLNICPTSNVKLGRVDSLKNHPISTLYRHGVDVTINSDDVLVFDSDVSKEYLRLHRHGVLSADELDAIRLNGLGMRESVC
jgi:adenosine deaminase